MVLRVSFVGLVPLFVGRFHSMLRAWGSMPSPKRYEFSMSFSLSLTHTRAHMALLLKWCIIARAFVDHWLSSLSLPLSAFLRLSISFWGGNWSHGKQLQSGLYLVVWQPLSQHLLMWWRLGWWLLHMGGLCQCQWLPSLFFVTRDPLAYLKELYPDSSGLLPWVPWTLQDMSLQERPWIKMRTREAIKFLRRSWLSSGWSLSPSLGFAIFFPLVYTWMPPESFEHFPNFVQQHLLHFLQFHLSTSLSSH